MKLDSLDVPITRKTDSQAVSLGFVVARRYYWQLFKVGVLSVLPVLTIAVILAVCFDYYFFSLLLIWWFKPFYDSAILCQASFLVLRQPTHAHGIMGCFKTVLNFGLLVNLTLRRFSLIRCVSLPTLMFDYVDGRIPDFPLKVTDKSTRAKASSMTIGLFIAEILLCLNAFLLLVMLFPELMHLDEIRWLLSNSLGKFSEELGWLVIAMLFFQALSCIIIGLFYVMIGFMLYLYSSIRIEGWGIELGFKRIANRLSKPLFYSIVMALSLVVVLQLGVRPAVAAVPLDFVVMPEQDKEVLKEIVLHETTNPYKAQAKWEKKISTIKQEGEIETKESSAISLPHMIYIAGLVKFLLIGVTLVAVLWGIYRYRMLCTFLGANKCGSPDTNHSQIVWGLNISESSLPRNVVEVAQELLEQKKYDAVLSLLYRASLAALVNQYQMVIKASDTERDCLSMAERVLLNDTFSYFQSLTNCWQNIVYAQRQPSISVMSELVSDWEGTFGQLPTTINRVNNDA